MKGPEGLSTRALPQHMCLATLSCVCQAIPLRRRIQNHFKAANELTKAVKSAVNDLYGARIHYRNECQKRKQEEQRDNMKRRRCLQGGEGGIVDNAPPLAAPAQAGTVFDYRDMKLPLCTAEEFKAMNLATARDPILISGSPIMESLAKDTTLKKELSDSITSFRVHPGRQGGVKVGIVDDSLRATVRTLLTQAMPEHVAHDFGSMKAATRDKLKDHFVSGGVYKIGCNPAIDTQQIQDSCDPDIWLRAAGTDLPIQEQLNLTALRLTMQGTRLVVVARLAELGEHVRNMKGSKAMKSPISCLATMQWLKNATLEQVKRAASEGVHIWAGSVGPSDLMFLPPGVVRVEKYSGGEDSVGLRMSFYHDAEPDAAEILRIAKADLLMMGKQNVLLNAILSLKETAAASPRPIAKPMVDAAAPQDLENEPKALDPVADAAQDSENETKDNPDDQDEKTGTTGTVRIT